MFSLVYKDFEYYLKDFRKEIEIPENDIILKEALQFCQQWINGKNVFTLHTSGSTGKPKAIEVTREQMKASATNTCKFLGINETDIALISLNPTYIAGKMMLVRSMESNFRAILIQPNTEEIKVYLKQLHFTFLAFVPLQLSAILESQLQKKIKDAKAILVGGAAIHHSLEQNIKKEKLPIYQTFGMTETVSHIALKAILEHTYYKVLPNISIKQDERGCLVVKGEVTQNEWLISNDLIEIVDNDSFRWLGRVDNIINTGGVKIQIEAIEEVINNFLFKEFNTHIEFVIVAIPDVLLGEKICLMIENSSFGKGVEEKLKNAIKNEVNQYAAPKLISYVTSLPKTPTLKVDRVEIRKFFIKK